MKRQQKEIFEFIEAFKQVVENSKYYELADSVVFQVDDKFAIKYHETRLQREFGLPFKIFGYHDNDAKLEIPKLFYESTTAEIMGKMMKEFLEKKL